jgi:short-subunit dehydrogenase
VSSAEALAALRDNLTAEGFSVRWLLNIAGVGIFGPLTGLAPGSIREVLDSNLLGTILTTREFLDDIVSNGGAICNVMSTAALVGRPHESAYVAAKWGARGFTEALRVELRGQPVRIMAVYPGGMRTSFWDRSPRHVDSARFMQPSDVARVIVSNLLDPSPCQVSDLRIDRLHDG